MVASLLFTLIFGLMQFGLIFYQWIEMEHAAREGARWASLRYDDASTREKVQSSAPGLSLADDDITIAPSNPDEDDQQEPVEVTVRHDIPVIAPFMEAILGTEGSVLHMTASATQMVE